MTKVRYAVGLTLGLALVGSFQNCAQTKFSEIPSGTVVASSSGTTSVDPVLSPAESPSPTPAPIATVSPSPAPVLADGPHSFVCVLGGPGSSTKLAYLDDDQLEGKTGTPSDICMSEKACKEIVTQKFDVREASPRGFCPDKNPNVIEFSDAQMTALMNKLPK